MKRYLMLTSVFALAACGGGSGGNIGTTPLSPSTPNTPTITVQGFSGGTTVNAENTSVTNMASYTNTYATSESVTRQSMIDYVNQKLNSQSRASLVRASTRRSAIRNGRDAEFDVADRALTTMKQVFYDMTSKSGSDLVDYVTNYKEAVNSSLILADKNVDSNTSVDDLISAFNTLGINSTNYNAKLDEFDTRFGITKRARMEDIVLKDTGGEGNFQFKLDDSGKIESITLLEDPTAEYGSSWANKRIVINASGSAEAVAPDPVYGLNPFEVDYITDQAGTLHRNGTGAEFTNTLHNYKFQLGRYNEGENPLVLSSGNDASTILEPDEFKNIEINSETELTAQQSKAKLIEYIIAKANKRIHNQHGGSDVQVDLDDAIEVINWYIDKINSSVTSDVVSASFQGDIQQITTMNGMGKEDGVKLKYSDFGYSKLVRTIGEESESQYLTYTGGYDDRRMDNAVVNDSLNGATFTGTGIVTVEDHHENKNNNTETLKTALYKDTSAQLQYNINGSNKAQHTLTMNNLKAVEGATPNSDWYKVVVQGTEENPVLTVRFDHDGKTIDSDYQFFKADSVGNITRNEANSIAGPQQIVRTDDTSNGIDMMNGTNFDGDHSLHGSASAEYYGQDPNNPTEATAGFYVDERWHNGSANTIQHELSAYGAFGGQKDQ